MQRGSISVTSLLKCLLTRQADGHCGVRKEFYVALNKLDDLHLFVPSRLRLAWHINVNSKLFNDYRKGLLFSPNGCQEMLKRAVWVLF